MDLETYKVQKLIANAGFCSRRRAEELIEQKRVTLNGKIAKPGDRATPNCRIEIDRKPINIKQNKKIYLILNKPVGFVSTMHDERNRKTAADLIKHKANTRVFIVGRLDLNSEGLMLFTNDGELAQQIMHPSHHITKTYEVKINKILQQVEIEKLRQGVFIDGKKTAPAKITALGSFAHSNEQLLRFELHEGKKRQIRRMLACFDAEVIMLKRTKIGPLQLGCLKPKVCRHLTASELTALKRAARLN